MSLAIFLFEIISVALFGAVVYQNRHCGAYVYELFLAVFYGVALEIFNIYMSGGAYAYHPAFLWQVAGVPLVIGLDWAVLYFLTGRLAQNFQPSLWRQPLLMALIALNFDLLMDPVMTDLGFWRWQIDSGTEWFGVPYSNFFGWLAVIWTFAAFMQIWRRFLQKHLSASLNKLLLLLMVITFLPFSVGGQIQLFFNLSSALSSYLSLSFFAAQGIFLAFLLLLLGQLAICGAKFDRFTNLTVAVLYFFLHSTLFIFGLLSGFFATVPLAIILSLLFGLIPAALLLQKSIQISRAPFTPATSTSENPF